MVPTYSPAAFIPIRGLGSRVWDQTGRELVDFAAGIATSSVGHAHPHMIKSLTEQAGRIWHVSNTLANEPAIRLASRLINATFADKVFFANSGGEANEAAFKLVRRYAHDKFGPQKNEIIAFKNGFHGRTFFTVSVGGQSKYSDGFGPKPGGITHLTFNDVNELEQSMSDNTCAVVLEPIQGESGILPASREFLLKARELCNKYKALLVFDEIQTGVGRCGHLYAYMHYGVTPDILTSAKGLGGGFPIGAMLTTTEVASVFNFGTHGSTFGGNPLGCAVGNAVLDLVNNEQTLKKVQTDGELIRGRVRELMAKSDLFSEVRGLGLLIGAALTDKYKGQARSFVQACEKQSLIALAAGPDVVRIAPSLLISQTDIVEGLTRFEKAVATFQDTYVASKK
jgi:acetylornithine/N-succinyldiaminopimelate aminotransferase